MPHPKPARPRVGLEGKITDDNIAFYAMTWKEIGAALGISPAHARTLGVRALDKAYDAFARRGINPSTLRNWLAD